MVDAWIAEGLQMKSAQCSKDEIVSLSGASVDAGAFDMHENMMPRSFGYSLCADVACKAGEISPMTPQFQLETMNLTESKMQLKTYPTI